MRILMTNWLYFPEFSGGALQCHRLSRKLMSLGAHVEVLAGTDRKELVGRTHVDGIPVQRVLRDKSTGKNRLLFGWNLFRYILKNHKKYDVLHAHGFHAPVSLAAWVTGLPLVQKITNLNLDDPVAVRRRRFGWGVAKIYSLAQVVVATSGLLEQACRQELDESQFRRIPNGVDTSLFCPVSTAERLRLRRKYGVDDDRIILLAVGSVSYRKGIDVLIQAVYQLKESVSEKFVLWVIGPQSYQKGFGQEDDRVRQFVEKVEKMVSFYGLEDVVFFKGTQSRIHEFMQAADIYVHPSRNEGQPNSILEAMASGLPTVANLIPGITDEIIQTGRFGYLVDCEDTTIFAAALKVLIKNPGLRQRLGRNARREIMNRYNLDDIAEIYLSLYQELTANRATTLPDSFKKMVKTT